MQDFAKYIYWMILAPDPLSWAHAIAVAYHIVQPLMATQQELNPSVPKKKKKRKHFISRITESLHSYFLLPFKIMKIHCHSSPMLQLNKRALLEGKRIPKSPNLAKLPSDWGALSIKL